MKTIGLIGGMSWESTVTYYQIINQTIAKELGGLHSAKCILYSVDFQVIESYQTNGEWGKSATLLADAALSLEKAGADFIVICTNTMHKVADIVQQNITIPILHIADLTAQALIEANVKSVALLGTKYTMEQDFYKSKLINNQLNVMIPNEDDRALVNHVIYDELCKGIINQQSKEQFVHIIEKLKNQGAQAVILGCTEIGLLIKQKDCLIPIFDTAEIHAKQAALFSIKEDNC